MKTIKLLFIIALFSNMGCKKENSVDYRDKYVGEYYFTTISQTWYAMDAYPTVYDTSIFIGTIRKFSNGDDTLDIIPYNNGENYDKRITIEFDINSILTPELNENGEFITYEAPPHYEHNGYFISKDELNFHIEDGGLGGGLIIDVKGIRK